MISTLTLTLTVSTRQAYIQNKHCLLVCFTINIEQNQTIERMQTVILSMCTPNINYYCMLRDIACYRKFRAQWYCVVPLMDILRALEYCVLRDIPCCRRSYAVDIAWVSIKSLMCRSSHRGNAKHETMSNLVTFGFAFGL